jgi:hypothetical protein
MEEGDLATLLVCNQTPINMVRQLGERRTLAEFLGSSAGMAFLGELAHARANVEASVPLWRELGDQAGLARSLGNLATLTKLEGDYARARALCAESRRQFESTGDRQGVAWSLNHEADAARWQGDVDGARRLLHDALEQFRSLGDDWGVGACLADLAAVEPERAEQLGREALRVLAKVGHMRAIGRTLDVLACAAALDGRDERALRLAGAAAAVQRVIGRSPLAERPPAEDRARLDRLLEPIRRTRGAAATEAWIAGWTAPLEETIGYALDGK